MADEDDDAEKTENPMQKRLDEALRHGDVAKSQEVNTWFVTAASALVLMSFSTSAAGELKTLLGNVLANAALVPDDARSLAGLFQYMSLRALAAVALPILLLAFAAICGNVVQHRLGWSFDVLMPNVARISPLSGAKRLFSRRALVGFAKGLVKLAIVGTTFVVLMW